MPHGLAVASRRATWPLFVLGIALALPSDARSQQPTSVQRTLDSVSARRASDQYPFTLLARPSRFAAAWPDGALYEGDMHVPVYLYSRTSALRSFLLQDVPRRWSGCFPWAAPPESAATRRTPSGRQARWVATGCTFNFVPHFVIRQLSSESSPVETPSFNPGVEFTWLRLSSALNRPGVAPDIGKLALLFAVHGRIAHYSNGQSGCFYTQFAKDSTNTCVRIAPGPDSPNLKDGDFSTHYAEIGVTHGWLGFSHEGFDERLLTGSVEARWYPRVCCGGMDDQLAKLYSRSALLGRIEGRLRYENRLMPSWLRHREAVTVSIEAECAERRPSGSDRCRTMTEGAVSAPGLYGLGVFARYATGWDYYNIGFLRRIPKRPAVGMFLQHAAPVFFAEPWRPWSRR